MREIEKTSATRAQKKRDDSGQAPAGSAEIPAPEKKVAAKKVPGGSRRGRKPRVFEDLDVGPMKQISIRCGESHWRELTEQWKASCPTSGPGAVGFGSFVAMQALSAGKPTSGGGVVPGVGASIERPRDESAKRAAETLAKTLASFQQAVDAICERLDRIEGTCAALAEETKQQTGAGREIAKAARRLGEAAVLFGTAFSK